MTRGAVNAILTRNKKLGLTAMPTEADQELMQQESLFYYGLVMTETCVVTIFKSNPDIAVMPQDINLITCYDQLTLKPEIGEAQANGIIKD